MTALAAAFGVTAAPVAAHAATPAGGQYIVTDSASILGINLGGVLAAVGDVLGVGGQVVQQLPAANGVLAQLTGTQVSQLLTLPTVQLTPNLSVALTSTTTTTTTLSGAPPAAVFPEQTGATSLWAQGDSGSGVNVAVVDTGIDPLPDFSGRLLPGVDLTGENNPYHDDYGHGTFVAGLIAGNGASSSGTYMGEAPGAGLISVKVAGASGGTTIATVIAGIDWVIAHQASEHIGVMNLSLGYVPVESTTVDPLAQAVERAWDSGIAVVVSAGNDGPFNGTVLSPGDDPLVITTGAVNDHGSTSTSGDTMAPFSSAGPTNPDGWFKPDLVTSGTSVVSLMAPGSTVATQNPNSQVGSGNFVGSGTSFSSAITSGAVALLLAAHPDLQPGALKAALLGTTAPGPVGDPFVDGHGLLNVAAASSVTGLTLHQGAGQLSGSTGVPLTVVVAPGSTVQGKFSVQVAGTHPAITTTVASGEITVPVACSLAGPAVGEVTMDIPATSYSVAANSGLAVTPSTAPGSTTAPDLCHGGLMYGAGHGAQLSFRASLLSTATSYPEKVQGLAVTALGLTASAGTATADPVRTTQVGDTVQLATTWAASTWNPALWGGAPPSASGSGTVSTGTATSTSSTPPNGTSPTNGSAWSGSAWNGSAWSGSAWSGSAWNGSAWNGSAWSGSAWNGSAWSGSAWSGSAWNGSAWSGSAWS